MAEHEKLGQRYAPPAANGSGPSIEPNEVYRLVYFSTSLLPSLDDGGQRDIQEILAASQSRNQKCGVTGALTFNELFFAQVLEGSRAEVGDIFRSIERDHRHTNVIVAEEGWVARRDFAAWAMAYVGDPGSLRVISPNLQLRDIVGERNFSAIALIEMMKFFLLSDVARR